MDQNGQTLILIPKTWLPLVRLAWVIIAIGVIGMFIIALPFRYAQLQKVSPQANTRLGELLPEEAVWLTEMSLSTHFMAVYFSTLEVISSIPFILVGWLIFLRKSDDLLGLIVSLSGILNGTMVIPVIYGLLIVLPGLELLLVFLRNLGILLLVVLFFIFPDGRFVPRWARLAAILWAAYLSLSLAVPEIRPPLGITTFYQEDIPILVFNVAFIGLSGAAQIYRYHFVSNPVQQQQTKWVVFGVSIAVLLLVLGTVMPSLFFPTLRQPGIPALQMRFVAVTVTLLFTVPVLPVTMAISILRYRLWDIDLVIRRTLQYSLLTASLGFIYFSSVTSLQSLYSSITGQESPAALVLSTLGIAALFNPLRRRTQDFIDRRFYRQKYDAEKALADFAALARQETDLHQLVSHLTITVQETMQPTESSVWLRKSD
jgi:hypothetical protein